MKRWLGLGLVLTFLVVAIVFLHGLAAEFPISALVDDSLELALGSIARLVGLAVAYWLIGSTVLLLAARLARLPAAVRALSPLTWRPLRKLVESSVASTLVLALSSPASATVVPGYVPVPAGDPTTTTTTPSPPSPTSTVPITNPSHPPAATIYLPIETARAEVVASTMAPTEVVVRPGDNMWLLAERHLHDLTGAPAGDAVVAPYWLAVIAANKDRIRSGDPDLIFPGEVLVLPAWSQP